MSRLLLVRHGETELKSSKRLWGHTDVKLSALGLKQAERLRDRLATQKIDAIYSSDLQRALATAKIIASRYQVEVTACAELREINFGKIEGLNFEEIIQLYPEVVKSLMQRGPNLKFPGGESLDELSNRVSKFVDRLKKHTTEETILIVVHSGVLRTLICQLLGIELWHIYQFVPDLASLSILETYSEGAILSLFNDTSHLSDS
ncbi:MAG: histidine phosphatase family protein [Dehalococcoidia bacterium]|nr:MAG: histidine phosphatase family protein [Dehalococcoidia bacterium]